MKDGRKVIPPFVAISQGLEEVNTFLRELAPVNQDQGLKVPPEILSSLEEGKKIRPGLIMLVASLFVGPKCQDIIAVSAAAEAVHLASLLHDDVIDETLVRRGLPTVNAAEGNRCSILLGDYLLTQATDIFCKLGNVEILRTLNNTVSQMTRGQLLELQHHADSNLSLEAYLEIISGKTASLMRFCSLMGGQLQSNFQLTSEQQEALAAFGYNLGMAFQIIDDMLDYWGSSDNLGKPTLNDIQEGKITLPFIVGLERSNQQQRATLEELLQGQHPISSEERLSLIEILDEYQVSLYCRDEAHQYAASALQSLDIFPNTTAKHQLEELVRYTLSRSR